MRGVSSATCACCGTGRPSPACGRVDFDVDRGRAIRPPFRRAVRDDRSAVLVCTEISSTRSGSTPELWSAAFELAADLDVTAARIPCRPSLDDDAVRRLVDGGVCDITGCTTTSRRIRWAECSR